MHFSRNKFTNWLLIIAGILVVTGASFYIYKTKFSADVLATADGQIDDATLADMAAAQKPSLPVIQLNYSKTQIETALADYQNTSLADIDKLSAIDKQINSDITAKEKASAQTGSDSLAFIILDKDGNQVNQAAGLNAEKDSTKAITSVADNFDFDSSVPTSLQKTMTDAYPLIQNIYGPRSNNHPIKVLYDTSNFISNYTPWTNEIDIHNGLDMGYLDAISIHELVHAFHGQFCLGGIWEEGFAEKVSEIVAKELKVTPDDAILLTGYRTDTLINSPTVYQPDLDPHVFGAVLVDKIYVQDQNFFKNFNTLLYQSDIRTDIDTKLIQMAAKVVPKIENEDSFTWFSHQYPLISYDYKSSESAFAWFGFFQTFSIPTTHDLTIEDSSYSDNNDFDVTIYDSAGNILLNKDQVQTVSHSGYYVGKNLTGDTSKFDNYYGATKVVFSQIGNIQNTNSQYFIKFPGDNPPEGLSVFSQLKGNIAVLTNLDSGAKTAVSDQNKGFSFPLPATKMLAQQGKFKVEVFNKTTSCSSTDLLQCLGTKVGETYFNKSDLSTHWYYTAIISGANNCAPSLLNVKPLNRSFSFTSITAVQCGQVVSLNGLPLLRYIGKDNEVVVDNLKKGTGYNYSVNYASQYSLIKKISGRTTTLSGPDFKLLSVKNFGDVAKGNFYRQVTFNLPYDPRSVKLDFGIDNGMGGMGATDSGLVWPAKITQVNSTTFKLSPTSKLYNNASYYVDGLDKILDMSGNPLYKFNWQLANFSMPLNPANAAQPTYTLSASTYHTSDKIVINKNFNSKNLLTKLSKIRLFRQIDQKECDNPNCGLVASSTSIVGNQIIIKSGQPMVAGNYWIDMPSVVDDNNNLVSMDTSETLNFVVN